MNEIDSRQLAETNDRLEVLRFLNRLSNTLLSTLSLKKLTHLTLSVITAPSLLLFQRAILFLHDEKCDLLKGALGVVRDESTEPMLIMGTGDILESRWEMSEAQITLQRSSAFCHQARQIEISIDSGHDCPMIRRLCIEHSIWLSDEDLCENCHACRFVLSLYSAPFAVVPLVARDKFIGIIIVDKPDSGNRSANNLALLRSIAVEAAAAIQNALQYNRLEETCQALRDTKEHLQHSERLAAVGAMATDLAHELKNPLIAIGGFASRLVKALPPRTSEHEYACTIVSETARLEKMLSEILDFSRKPNICFDTCCLDQIVKESLANCAYSFDEKNICVSYENDHRHWYIYGDSHQLKQVFLNLILNSCDAMPEGGELKLAISAEPGDKTRVLVTVEDNGPGIEDGVMENIFSPFYTTKKHGTGLGLPISKRIVLNHSGSIEAVNSGHGTIFKVSFPHTGFCDL